MTDQLDALLDSRIRAIPDWPQPGVTFRDITPLLADPAGLRAVVTGLAQAAAALGDGVDAVAGIEARGFVLGAPLALELGVGFLPVRKQGKLPGDVHAESYDLEYGQATLELQAGSVPAAARVLIVDDVLATGGTAAATVSLVRAAGAEPVGIAVLLELAALGGRARLDDLPVTALRVL